MRPLFGRAVAEHEALAAEAGAERYFSRRGWLKLYRTDRAFAALAPELELAARLGIANVPLDRDEARALEPALAPVFRHAVHWTGAVSVTNPLELTRAYAARFAALGGLTFTGDARTLHRANPYWRVETAAGPLDAGDVVIALGPWANDVLGPLGVKLPLGRQARLPPPFPSARQRRSEPPGSRCREWLPAGAHGAGHPRDDGRRVRRP